MIRMSEIYIFFFFACKKKYVGKYERICGEYEELCEKCEEICEKYEEILRIIWVAAF